MSKASVPPQVPGYEVDDLLGEGGMGVVWRARRLSDGRGVALKVMRAGGARRAAEAKRFVREYQSLAALDHPGLPAVFGHGTLPGSGEPWVAMELLAGHTLDHLPGYGRLPGPELTGLARQLLQTLALVHGKGMVHRDVKPGNVFVTGSGRVVLLDFDLALMSDRTRLTATGAVVGTLATMAPEQLRGAPSDARTDLFGLGATLTLAATGQPPFSGSALLGLSTGRPTPAVPSLALARPDLPRELVAFVDRCLRAAPADRPRDARDALALLEPGAGAGAGATLTGAAPPVAAPIASASAASAPGAAFGAARGRRVVLSASLAVASLALVLWAVALRLRPQAAEVRPAVGEVAARPSARPSARRAAALLRAYWNDRYESQADLEGDGTDLDARLVEAYELLLPAVLATGPADVPSEVLQPWLEVVDWSNAPSTKRAYLAQAAAWSAAPAGPHTTATLVRLFEVADEALWPSPGGPGGASVAADLEAAADLLGRAADLVGAAPAAALRRRRLLVRQARVRCELGRVEAARAAYALATEIPLTPAATDEHLDADASVAARLCSGRALLVRLEALAELELRPPGRRVEHLRRLAAAYATQGHLSEAAATVERALSLAPTASVRAVLEGQLRLYELPNALFGGGR